VGFSLKTQGPTMDLRVGWAASAKTIIAGHDICGFEEMTGLRKVLEGGWCRVPEVLTSLL
jgi:hypothetical protein